ncbi:heterokaryon incompatibility protein-domain-containing protein [Halenospora varia]|nr:heterokaryon incompatibility protein-domain-containing protein [Halenospora varia]
MNVTQGSQLPRTALNLAKLQVDLITGMNSTQLFPESPPPRRHDLGASLHPTPLPALYQPLDVSKLEIRVLRILPEVAQEIEPLQVIQCIMQHVSLDEKPVYHALSYTWQDDTLGESFKSSDMSGSSIKIQNFVSLNGHKIEVTRNLWVALWHFRHAAGYFKDVRNNNVLNQSTIQFSRENHLKDDDWLWVDALCINQDDLLERNAQVGRMGRLFEVAKRVHVWLGIATRETSLLIQLLKRYESIMDSTGLAKSMTEFESMLRDPSLGDQWGSLVSICCIPYWQRLWIIQEMVLASDIVFQIGPLALSYYPFTGLLRCLSTAEATAQATNNYGPASISNTAVSIASYKVRRNVVKEQCPRNQFNIPFYSLLQDFRQQKCSDPRDLIYGLLGISDTATQKNILVNYSTNVNELYILAAWAAIKDSGNLDIICNPEKYSCQCKESEHLNSNLPSWVPDWRCIRQNLVPIIERGRPTEYTGHFFWTAKPDVRFTPRLAVKPNVGFTPDNRTMLCKGILVGVIENMWRPVTPNLSSRILVHKFLRDLGSFAYHQGNSVDIGYSARFPPLKSLGHEEGAIPRVPASVRKILQRIYQVLFFDKRITHSNTLSEEQFITICTSSSSDSILIEEGIATELSLQLGHKTLFILRRTPLKMASLQCLCRNIGMI